MRGNSLNSWAKCSHLMRVRVVFLPAENSQRAHEMFKGVKAAPGVLVHLFGAHQGLDGALIQMNSTKSAVAPEFTPMFFFFGLLWSVDCQNFTLRKLLRQRVHSVLCHLGFIDSCRYGV